MIFANFQSLVLIQQFSALIMVINTFFLNKWGIRFDKKQEPSSFRFLIMLPINSIQTHQLAQVQAAASYYGRTLSVRDGVGKWRRRVTPSSAKENSAVVWLGRQGTTTCSLRCFC